MLAEPKTGVEWRCLISSDDTVDTLNPTSVLSLTDLANLEGSSGKYEVREYSISRVGKPEPADGTSKQILFSCRFVQLELNCA